MGDTETGGSRMSSVVSPCPSSSVRKGRPLTHPPAHSPIRPPNCPPAHPPIHPSIRPPNCPPARPPDHPATHPPTHREVREVKEQVGGPQGRGARPRDALHRLAATGALPAPRSHSQRSKFGIVIRVRVRVSVSTRAAQQQPSVSRWGGGAQSCCGGSSSAAGAMHSTATAPRMPPHPPIHSHVSTYIHTHSIHSPPRT